MNKIKSDEYQKLVQSMQKQYPTYNKNASNEYEMYAPYVNGEMICKEINFYTYWQGLDYAKNTPQIKYLFVAQDWGSLFIEDEGLKQCLERIKKINNGCKDIPYFDEKYKFSQTDENLIKLFNNAGYDLQERNSDLFFTNFCLGYRRDKDVKITKDIMMKDSSLFKQLYEILEPENIICMGKLTFECLYETLNGKPYPEINNFSDFMKLVNSHKKICIKKGKKNVYIYPILHCGKNGIDNIMANSLTILGDHIPQKNNLSPLVEYILKLMKDRGIETPKDVFTKVRNGKIKLKRKLLSDLRLGKIKTITKKTAITIIFALQLSKKEIDELIKIGNYRFSNNDTFDKIFLEAIEKHNLDPIEFDWKLHEARLKRFFAKKIINPSDLSSKKIF